VTSIRCAVKSGIDACCLALVSFCALTCAIEALVSHGNEGLFTFWAQTFALVPGLPGVFLRRAFYRLTLEKCARNFFIGFGALFSHRQVIIEEDVFVGTYALVGSAWLRRGCLIGSRSSIVSGGAIHALDAELRWMPSDLRQLRRIVVGEHSWIGEASLILADVGRSAMVAAGSVVSTAVPPGILVAGNPSRFVRRLTAGPSEEEAHPVASNAAVR
jgi:acetyltransferase-like isoleucine patch superfamily enzyme